MLAGRVGRPHGLDGFFHVTDPSTTAAHARRRARGPRADHRPQGSRRPPILRVETARDRTAVEGLRGRELHVDDAIVPPLGEDEYYAEQLEGCTVADGDRDLGVVVRLMGLPSCEALELDSGLIVPMVRDAIRSVDIEAKRIEVDAEFLGAA
jgi:16S rRNA processing protein RimM